VLGASQEAASAKLDDSTAVAVVAITGTANREAATAGSVSKLKRDLRVMGMGLISSLLVTKLWRKANGFILAAASAFEIVLIL
jgi:hypothetical protein